jgi:hypothetical protein
MSPGSPHTLAQQEPKNYPRCKQVAVNASAFLLEFRDIALKHS